MLLIHYDVHVFLLSGIGAAYRIPDFAVFLVIRRLITVFQQHVYRWIVRTMVVLCDVVIASGSFLWEALCMGHVVILSLYIYYTTTQSTVRTVIKITIVEHFLPSTAIIPL
jgi:hypothetical protein